MLEPYLDGAVEYGLDAFAGGRQSVVARAAADASWGVHLDGPGDPGGLEHSECLEAPEALAIPEDLAVLAVPEGLGHRGHRGRLGPRVQSLEHQLPGLLLGAAHSEDHECRPAGFEDHRGLEGRLGHRGRAYLPEGHRAWADQRTADA